MTNARKESPIATSPIVFVLVGPRVPGNLGSICRTSKAFGFPAVRLVRSPIDLADREAVRLAHGAEDLLAQVQTSPTLDAALAGCSRAIGTTARPRDWSRRVLSPEDLAEELAGGDAQRDSGGALEGGAPAPIAIVFGPEDRGLTNDELARCDAIVSIPIANPGRDAERATLSLPASHAIISAAAARAFARAGEREGASRPAARGPRSQRGARALASSEIDALLEEIRATLTSIGFRARPNETRFRGSLRDFLARAHPTEGDRLFLRHMLAQTGKWARRVAGDS